MLKKFTEKIEWMDWKATLINLLTYQSVRNGVPLNHVISDNVVPILWTNTNLLDDSVDRNALIGRVFNANASKVPSYIVRFISEYTVSKHKLPYHKDADNGCVDYFALQEFYEGVGANAKAVLTSKKDIQEIFYGGENPPHMWWEKFEVKLTNALHLLIRQIRCTTIRCSPIRWL